MSEPEDVRPSWQGSPEHLAMEAEVEATVVRRYSYAVERLLDAVGATDADAVRRAQAQAQLARIHRRSCC